MKIYEITESAGSAGSDEMIDAVYRDCQPWLKKSGGRYIYRGMKPKGTFKKMSVRTDRKIKDSPQELTDAINNSLYTLGYKWINRSNALFVAGYDDIAKAYGQVYRIFPIGNFKFVWNPNARDPYADYYANYYSNKELTFKENKFWKRAGQYYTDKNLKDGINSGNEIMIRVESYYAISEHWMKGSLRL